MAIAANKKHSQLFDLLRSAPMDTFYGIAHFLTTKICNPTNNPLEEISNKTLARHLNALLNGDISPLGLTSPRRRRASKPSPIVAKLMPFGSGDASRRGEWHGAVDVLERFIDMKTVDESGVSRRMRVGEALCFFGARTRSGQASNLEITLLASWLLGDGLTSELVRYFRELLAADFYQRAKDTEWLAKQSTPEKKLHSSDCVTVAGDLRQNFRLSANHDWLKRYIMQRAIFFAGGDEAKATALAGEIFAPPYVSV